jgi:2-polyprenyl-6-methoxyphenol hydroxylase-like FAD-dependent oxidoreductase
MKLWNPANEVIVFERNKKGDTHGWGVTVEGPFLNRLAGLDAESAAEIAARSVSWREQAVEIYGGREVNRDNGTAYGVSRQRFVDILAARAGGLGVEIRYEQDIRDTSQLPEADLILAADGVSSQLRASSAQFRTRVTEGQNKYIWLGTGKVWDAFNFFFVPTEAGWIWAHAYPHELMTSTFIVECEERTWAALGFGDASPSRTCDMLEQIFADQLEGRRLWTQFPDGMDARWLNFRTVSNERWYHGNVVLAGDCAHTAHFTVGLGTTLALQDVIALADQLRRADDLAGDGMSAALTAYQEGRQAELQSHATDAQRSAQWFENVPRYADLSARQFAAVLHARRAPLLPKLPPRLFCLLNDLRQRSSAVNWVRQRSGLAARLPARRPPSPRSARYRRRCPGRCRRRPGGWPRPPPRPARPPRSRAMPWRPPARPRRPRH